MEITLKFGGDWVGTLKTIALFVLSCLITFWLSKHYIDMQKRDAEEGQRRIDEMNRANAQDDDFQE